MTDSAESYLNQALATYETLYGADHTKTLEGKDELARLMIRTDRIEVSSLIHAEDRFFDTLLSHMWLKNPA